MSSVVSQAGSPINIARGEWAAGERRLVKDIDAKEGGDKSSPKKLSETKKEKKERRGYKRTTST